MPAGLEVYSAAGNKIFDSAWGNARILGSFVATTANGSRTITTLGDASRGNLFAYRTPFSPLVLGLASNIVSDKVVTSGNTITWTGLTNLPVTIVYGDAYR